MKKVRKRKKNISFPTQQFFFFETKKPIESQEGQEREGERENETS